MMSSDLFFREKIPVAVLGATSLIGQQFVQLLARHPWFEVVALCDTESLVGQRYEDVVDWLLSSPLPDFIAQMPILSCIPILPCTIVFSALDFEIAPAIEMLFAESGCYVISQFSYPVDLFIPSIVAEVNPEHLSLIEYQKFDKGKIISTPSSAVVALTLVLKPLLDQFALDAVQVVTMQSFAEAIYQQEQPSELEIFLYPVEGAEGLVEDETLKILGPIKKEQIENANFKISAQTSYITKKEEDLVWVSVKLKQKAQVEHLIQAWRQFAAWSHRLELPTAPFHALYYFKQPDVFQSQIQCSLDKGMAVCISNLRPCSVLDYKFSLHSSHLIRGIAGSALLIAELLVVQGKIFW